ncbi:multidrug efflux RND transporter permease subunit [Beijerinckia indica]|uniref:Acriflavin resistance protein n=1 Tax=Beijerinckia indica subsp. indica (strain ATCC 9039 / DSM 1715 / NCIMB 8712) TaxID=395963 RepID=B2IJ47_BEII9|nr:multidrug efflux RND transporter permease subunit [Beijerinckia indica]ACB94810.1 acriflavin resistance protein [Beijerinckia indica subsp. indica ATCC 9039]
MSISQTFILRPIATSLLMLGILLIGAAAYPLLPVASLPMVDFPTIQVTTQFPGASPETMASSVTQPLERQFGQIPGVTQMTSSSTLGYSTISVQFDLSRNIDGAAQDIQTAINAASGQLPKQLPTPPTYKKVDPADAPIIVLAVTSDAMPLTVVDDYAENILAQNISRFPGVSMVEISGQQKPAVRIQVDPAKVAALGLSLEDLRLSILNATANSPKGSIDGATRTYTIYANDQELKAEPWNDFIIAYRNGAPVRIRDIGRAIDASENTKMAAWANGKPAILLPIMKQPGTNVIDTVDSIKAALPRLQAAIPPTIKVAILSDRTQTIRASVDDVQFTLVLTIGLVVAVIFVFLRNFWSTIIPGVAVPLALVGTFALMYVMGYSLDNLSLMGLTIAVGFVVDDAIVMLENIHRHIEDGMTPMQAAIKGSAEIGFTIISISLSLVAVFIPLLLMGGIVGRLFREFAITVTMTIFVSALVSLTLTPMMCSRFLRSEHGVRHGRLYMASERIFDLMLAGYRKTLDIALRHHRITFAIFLATLVATFYLFIIIPKGFFPQQDTGIIIATSETSQDVSFAEMIRRESRLAEIVMKDPAVASVSMSAGANGSQTQNNGRFFITLKPQSERTISADQIIQRLRPQLAKVEGAALFMQVAQDLNVGARVARTQYQYTLQDADLAELNQWAPKIFAKLKTLPELRDIASDQQTGGGTLSLTIDRDQASRFGIQPQLIDDTLYDAFGQRQVTQYFTQVNTYHVVMEVLPELQNRPGALDEIYINSPLTGQPVPLNTLVKWTTQKTALLSINHQSQFPAVTLSFNLAPGVALGQATAAIHDAEMQLGAPASLTGNFQGNAQAFQASLASEPYLVTAAIIVIYIILGVLYESYIHPLTILSTLPSAGLGALLTLILFGYDFSLIALIGIILLIGIVKKNGIMMVDFAIEAERNQGLPPLEAIREACLLRFRPIMMTTMAAVLGGIPLMIGTGTGSEIRQPLGYAMVGGLLVSQALTLYTTPVIYLYLDRLRSWISRRSPARSHPTTEALHS